MALTPGTRLGPYEILSPLGSGGMGEVYRARDTRLQRTVAIKVLPAHVLSDPGLRARFEREARTISSLDHPNICVLHDVGREADLEYLVMQHLDGETLAARLARGPLTLAEALRYGADIASALDKAHRAGVLHRDIKPGNVMLVKSSGITSAKLLDFGLAKTVGSDDLGGVGGAPATATSPLTGRGTILGTLLYMSPEQLEGGELDGRSDIFSFGAMLYEMVTGRRAFDGSSQASVIGAILERDPPPMAASAPLTPPALDRAVRKCLAKDRDRRWQSAADLCDELTWIAESSDVQLPPTRPAHRRRITPGVVATAAALFLVALAAVIPNFWRDDTTAPDGVVRDLEISLPSGIRLAPGGIAVSPDGKTVVFTAWSGAPAAESTAPSRTGETRLLYLRRFDRSDATPIPGSEGARAPFFSPDGEWIGFFTSRSLQKVSLRGGPPVRVGGTPPVTRGGVWLPDNSIIVSPTQSTGLARFPPDGPPALFTHPDANNGEKADLWPALLPGSEHLLYTIRRGTTTDMDASDIGLLHIATGERRVLMRGAAFGQYSPSGHLLFVRAGTLSAVPFDLKTKQVSGTAVPIVTGVALNPWLGGAHYTVTPDGALLVLKGSFPEERSTSQWVDRTGKSSPAAGIEARRGLPGQPRIAPDGTRAMFDAPSADGDDEVFMTDLKSGTAVRLSNDPGDDFDAIWTPDGKRLVWTSLPPGRLPFLVMRATDGGGRTEEIAAQSNAQFSGSVSAANVLAYTLAKPEGQSDIWTVPLDGARKPTEFVNTPAIEYGPEFSPDGKWIAYVSNESGVLDIYVVPYPGPGGKRRVTLNGGVSPVWSRDGRELFYQSEEGLMAVAVRASAAGLEFGAPRRLFGPTYAVDSREDGPRGYDVGPDGRFLMFLPQATTAPPLSFHVLLNWASTLKPGAR